MTTEILLLQEIGVGDAGKEVLHNLALRQLEARLIRVLSRSTIAQPGSPAVGDTYIVPTGATGGWSGQVGKIAHYYAGAWVYYTSIEGITLWVNDENIRVTHNGTKFIRTEQVSVLTVNRTTYTRTSDNATDTSEASLTTFVVKGGTLDVMDSLRITCLWEYTNSATAKTLYNKFGATNILAFSGAASTATAQTQITLTNDNSLTAQLSSSTTSSAFGTSTGAIVTPSENTANDVTIDFRCKWAANVTPAETIKLRRYLIEVLRA